MGKTENYLSSWNFNICGNLKIILTSPNIYIFNTGEFLSSMTKAIIMQVSYEKQ